MAHFLFLTFIDFSSFCPTGPLCTTWGPHLSERVRLRPRQAKCCDHALRTNVWDMKSQHCHHVEEDGKNLDRLARRRFKGGLQRVPAFERAMKGHPFRNECLSRFTKHKENNGSWLKTILLALSRSRLHSEYNNNKCSSFLSYGLNMVLTKSI